jgi:glycosyltransferase involved in cell wall biosynthesis
MEKLSVVIITLNEAADIERAIRSVEGLADEVVVVDSGSTDGTQEAAQRAGARVVHRDFTGYGEQKAFASEQARNRWVLNIDADEHPSEELKASIRQVLARPEHAAYTMNVLTSYCGRYIRHCGWYPNKKLRLWDRQQGSMSLDKVHEGWRVAAGASIGHLMGDLLHEGFPTIDSHMERITRYSEIGARFDLARGKRVSWAKLVFGPSWVFFATYVIRGGFRDGYPGYLVSRNSAVAAWVKYAKMRLYARSK